MARGARARRVWEWVYRIRLALRLGFRLGCWVLTYSRVTRAVGQPVRQSSAAYQSFKAEYV